MKITCDKCGANYKIPDDKLTKEVSRATCKKCGNKITIRKGGATGTAYDFDDDDSVVNHEERTVIATVPEIQQFDATPALASPAHGQATAPTPASAPAAASRPVDATPAAATRVQAGAPISAPSPASPVNSTGSSLLPTPGSLTGGVHISNVSQMEIGPLPMIMAGVGLLGLLMFLPGGVWSAQTSSAVGFFLALFGNVGVLFALFGLKKNQKVNPPTTLGGSLGLCIILFLGLLLFQGKENMAFLGHKAPERVALVEGVTGIEGLDWEYADVEVIDEKTGEKTTVRKKVKKSRPAGTTGVGMPGVENIALNDQNGGTAGGLQDNGVAQPSTGIKLTTDAGGSTERTRSDLPGSNLLAMRVDSSTQVNKEQVNTTLTTDRTISNCFAKHAERMKLSGRIVLGVDVLPAGNVSRARFKTVELQDTELEKCVATRAVTLSVPAFKGDGPAKVDVTFVM